MPLDSAQLLELLMQGTCDMCLRQRLAASHMVCAAAGYSPCQLLTLFVTRLSIQITNADIYPTQVVGGNHKINCNFLQVPDTHHLVRLVVCHRHWMHKLVHSTNVLSEAASPSCSSTESRWQSLGMLQWSHCCMDIHG